jgi:hypothetical protein
MRLLDPGHASAPVPRHPPGVDRGCRDWIAELTPIIILRRLIENLLRADLVVDDLGFAHFAHTGAQRPFRFVAVPGGAAA